MTHYSAPLICFLFSPTNLSVTPRSNERVRGRARALAQPDSCARQTWPPRWGMKGSGGSPILPVPLLLSVLKDCNLDLRPPRWIRIVSISCDYKPASGVTRSVVGESCRQRLQTGSIPHRGQQKEFVALLLGETTAPTRGRWAYAKCPRCCQYA